MQEPYWWYVLHVRPNTEHKAVAHILRAYNQKNIAYELDAFCPETEQFYRNKQTRILGKQYVKRPMFPGYIFVETNMASSEFRNEFFDVIYNSTDIIRLLRYGDSDDIALHQEERMRFEYLFKGTKCLDHSVGYIVGENIVITGGSLMGMEGCIKKINRHNRTADLEIKMFNQKQTIKVALEIVSKK